MEITEQIKLRFKGVDFPSVILKSIKPYKENDSHPMRININPKVFIPKDSQNSFKIIMEVDLSVEEYFVLNVTAVGLFELTEEEVSEDIRKSFINANSTAILFPYVRSFISSLTSSLGNVTSSILLPTRFFKGDYLEEITQE